MTPKQKRLAKERLAALKDERATLSRKFQWAKQNGLKAHMERYQNELDAVNVKIAYAEPYGDNDAR